MACASVFIANCSSNSNLTNRKPLGRGSVQRCFLYSRDCDALSLSLTFMHTDAIVLLNNLEFGGEGCTV